MTEIYEGGCMCGAVRFKISGELKNPMLCHCKTCQKQSGSAVSTIIGVAATDIEVEGEVKTFVSETERGGTIDRQFCPACGSPLFSLSPNLPDMVFVKVGTFDDTDWYRPQLNIWTGSAQAWYHIDPELMSFERNPGG